MPLRAFTRPDLSGKSGVGQLAAGQLHGLVEQVRVGQAAQRKAQPVATGAGAKRGAQISPGLAQGVFIQRSSSTAGAHALAGHGRAGTGQTGLQRGVAPAAGVKVDLHIEHGNGWALHQKDLRTGGLRPVRNGQRGLSRWQAQCARGQCQEQKFHRWVEGVHGK